MQSNARKAIIGAAVALVLLLGSMACIGFPPDPPVLPEPPSDLTVGIVVYEHANYLGQSAHVMEDISHLASFGGPCAVDDYDGYNNNYDLLWDDCISSIRVAPGWRAILYRHDSYTGDQLEVTENIPNLRLVQGKRREGGWLVSGKPCEGGFDECVTSIRLIRP